MSKIPYFASFIRHRKLAQPNATEFTHEPINLFDVALKGIESGYRQCFRILPIDLLQYRALFETYKFLEVDVLSGLSVDEVIANLKPDKANYATEERRPVPGNKGLARDTAFQLLYLILHGHSQDQAEDITKLFDAVLYVASHSRTFKYRTKRVVRAAYEEQFELSTKQRARLDEWDKKDVADDGTDATTKESDRSFASDYSF